MQAKIRTVVCLSVLVLAAGLVTGCSGFDVRKDPLPPAPHLAGILPGPVDMSPATPRYRYRLGSTYVEWPSGRNRARPCRHRHHR